MKEHKRVYVVMSHVAPPADYRTLPEGYRLERCEVVTRITNKQTTESTFILDAVNSKVVKTRNPLLKFDELYKYFKEKYPQHFDELDKILHKD